MAQFRIDVVIDPQGAVRGGRVVDRTLDRIEDRADRTSQLLQRAFTFIGAGVGIQQLTTLIDTFDNLQNRLRTVTTGTAELAVVNQELLQISNDTRSSFEASVELFARTARATRNLGISQQQTLDFTKSLNQAIILSGATAVEAEAGLIQLAQGLASGSLQGDELRSVLEQLPEVADVIAKSLGRNRAELRQLGSEGRISAQVILNAFAEAREELEERFSKLPPTIGQAFTVLRNNIIQLLGTFSETSRLSRTLAEGILVLADNLGTLARVAAAAGIALGVQFARVGVGAAIRAVQTLTTVIAANPLGALLVGITAAVSALIAFSDQIKISEEGVATLQDLAVATFEAISQAVEPFIDLISGALDSLLTSFEAVFGKIDLSISGILLTAAKVVDTTIGLFKGLGNAILIAIQLALSKLPEPFISAFNAVLRVTTDFINRLIGLLNRASKFLGGALIEPIQAFQIDGAKIAELTGEDIGRAFFKGVESQTAAVVFVEDLLERTQEIGRQREAEEAERLKRLEAARAALTNLPDPVDRQEQVRKKLNEQEEIIKRIQEEFGKTGKVIEESIVGAFNRGEEALVDFFTTGKFGFRELVDSIQRDLTRIAVRQTITAPLAGLFAGREPITPGGGGGSPLASLLGFLGVGGSGSGGGGAGGFLRGLIPGFQNGGSFRVGGTGGVDNNVLSVNNQPVARVSRGETVAVQPQEGAGGGRPIVINYNITTQDADSFRRSEDQILARTSGALNRASRRNN